MYLKHLYCNNKWFLHKDPDSQHLGSKNCKIKIIETKKKQ